MSKKPYTPKPGSLAEQVIQHLRQTGRASIEFAAVAKVFGKPRTNVEPCLRAAIAHGALVRVAPAEVRLPTAGEAAQGGTGQAVDSATPRAPRKTTRRGGARKTAGSRGSAGRAQAASTEDPPSPAGAVHTGPVACLWDDGDVVLHGLKMNEDGNSATVGEAHARRPHAFLDRLFGTPVAQPLRPGGMYMAPPTGVALLTGEASR